jgi:hypothetical protein
MTRDFGMVRVASGLRRRMPSVSAWKSRKGGDPSYKAAPVQPGTGFLVLGMMVDVIEESEMARNRYNQYVRAMVESLDVCSLLSIADSGFRTVAVKLVDACP